MVMSSHGLIHSEPAGDVQCTRKGRRKERCQGHTQGTCKKAFLCLRKWSNLRKHNPAKRLLFGSKKVSLPSSVKALRLTISKGENES